MVEPITDVCIVDKKGNCPPDYVLIDKTFEGEDADLWKDGLFRSKVTRYVCYTKSITAAQWNHIVTKIALISSKDPTPQGYTILRETKDTKEQAMKKHVLCIMYTPKPATNAAITELILTKSDTYRGNHYSTAGEVNGLSLCYKIANLPPTVSSRPAPPTPNERQTVTPLRTSPPPVPQRPRLSVKNSLPDKKNEPLAGIPFKLHDKFLTSNSNNYNQDNLNIIIKSKSELEESFSYDFSKERSILIPDVDALHM